MNPIQPRTTPAELPTQPATEFGAAAPAGETAPADPVVQSLADAANGGADVQARFKELFGDARAQVLYADRRGGVQGGNNTKSTKQADPLANKPLPGQKDVTIAHSVGDPKGYTSKNHAIAWARGVGEGNATVVKIGDKWHAVVTDKQARTQGAAIHVGKVDPVEFQRLRSAAIEAQKTGDTSKWKTFAAYALGIPESEIKVIGKGDTPSSTHVNINLSPNFDAEGRAASFRDPPWVQLGPAAFDRPANAVATLAHEEVHAGHRRLAIEWYGKYEKADHGKMSFRDWVAERTKGKGFEAIRTAELVAGVQDGTYATTELEAHIEAARLAFASGDLVQARTDLAKVANLKVLPAQLQTKEYSFPLLKELRDGLSGDARKAFDEVVKGARGDSILNDRRLK